MTIQTNNRVRDVYWYEVIKNILSNSKHYLFTIQIWEKMRDNYGYSYDEDRVEKELMNLQRAGYAISIDKRGKQAWMFPTGKKLLVLEKNKKIDSAIAEFISASNHMLTKEEIIAKINETVDPKVVSERLVKISKLIDLIDKILKETCRKKSIKNEGEKKQVQAIKPNCIVDERDMFLYETIIDLLDGSVEDIDILTIVSIIDARKKYYKKQSR